MTPARNFVSAESSTLEEITRWTSPSTASVPPPPSSTPASIADQELQALLSAHRQRRAETTLEPTSPPTTCSKLLDPTSPSNGGPNLFATDTFDDRFDKEWRQFIAGASYGTKICLSMYVYFLVLILHCLQR